MVRKVNDLSKFTENLNSDKSVLNELGRFGQIDEWLMDKWIGNHVRGKKYRVLQCQSRKEGISRRNLQTS